MEKPPKSKPELDVASWRSLSGDPLSPMATSQSNETAQTGLGALRMAETIALIGFGEADLYGACDTDYKVK